MNAKLLFLFMCVVVKCASTSPLLKDKGSWLEELETEDKIREKRKIDLLQQLETAGIGVKKSLTEEEEKAEEALPKAEEPDLPKPESEATDEEAGVRSKKQIPNNVCIEIPGCGRTACGTLVSARGPSVKTLLRSNAGGGDVSGRLEAVPTHGIQSRTFDSLLSINPLASAVSYAVPATTYAAEPASTLAHTILKPAIAAPVPVAHIEPISVNLFSHPLPVQPLHTMIAHHHPLVNLQRLEVPKVQEILYAPAEVKQPQAYEVKPIIGARPEFPLPYMYPSRYGSRYDGPMICHPYDEKTSQQVIQIRPEVHLIDGSSIHKSSNGSAEEFKSQSMDEEERKVHEHLRQVNEIREDITKLNIAAQKIVDQQERLAEMQQRHLWKSEGHIPMMERTYSPYYANRMVAVPMTYSGANALRYPSSPEDIEFFVNLLKAGKQIGALSEALHPALMSGLDTAKLIVSAGQNAQSSKSDSVPSSKLGQNGSGKSSSKDIRDRTS